MATVESKLLSWMSHRGVTRKAGLRDAVASLRSEWNDDRQKTYVNTFRRRLLELGHAEPLDDANNEWEILPPYFVLLTRADSNSPVSALLCGGRTPAFLAKVQIVAEASGVGLIEDLYDGDPARFTFDATNGNSLTQMAQALDIPIIDAAPRRMLQQVASTDRLMKALSHAVTDPLPPVHQREIWSWEQRNWMRGGTVSVKEGELLRVSGVGYGPKPHLIHYKNQWRRLLSETEAKFVSARLQNETVGVYDEEHKRLTLTVRPPY